MINNLATTTSHEIPLDHHPGRAGELDRVAAADPADLAIDASPGNRRKLASCALLGRAHIDSIQREHARLRSGRGEIDEEACAKNRRCIDAKTFQANYRSHTLNIFNMYWAHLKSRTQILDEKVVTSIAAGAYFGAADQRELIAGADPYTDCRAKTGATDLEPRRAAVAIFDRLHEGNKMRAMRYSCIAMTPDWEP